MKRRRKKKKELPREQQLNENSSLKPKRVQSSRNCQNKGSVVCFQQPRCCTSAPTSAQLDPDLREKPAFVWKGHVTPRVSAHKAAVSHSNASRLWFPSAAAGLPRDNTVKTQLRSSPHSRSLCWKLLLVYVTTAAAETGNSASFMLHLIDATAIRFLYIHAMEYLNVSTLCGPEPSFIFLLLSTFPVTQTRPFMLRKMSHMCSFKVIYSIY